ncbi:FAD-dependent oxidoreductase [Patulibacter sp. NPDC049589]|uniref:NAD(P)/FAD-dependent oxidoreductase n=1 Tax=Patulibacter sp. NPDC049589 TaxID=3154731 RepID=UPI003421A9AE
MHAALIVVGAGPAGRSAAEGYRDAGGDGRVVLLGDEGRLPYERPPLTKDFLRGASSADDLPISGPGWYADRAVEVLPGKAAIAIDPGSHVVRLADGTTVGYDRCVLATGSAVATPPIDGAGAALAETGSGSGRRVHVVRSADQATDLRGAAASSAAAVVVGSGFIGCEAAVSIARRGTAVTLVAPEALPQKSRLGADVGRRIAAWLVDEGVTLRLGTAVERLDPDGVVVTADGRLESDVVLLATGHAPRADLAVAAGIPTRDGRVLADAGMWTRTSDVLAAGDVALAQNAAAGRRLAVEHWGEALAMGRIAGANAAGATESWAQAPGFWSSLGDRTLKQVAWGDGFDAVVVEDHGAGTFTARYGRAGVLVGVLTHDRDEDYERGRELVETGAPFRP